MNAEHLLLQNLIERSCFAGCLHLACNRWTETLTPTFISLPNFGAKFVWVCHAVTFVSIAVSISLQQMRTLNVKGNA